MTINFFKHFYLFSKLTTTIVLFISLMFLGYIFYKAYQTNSGNKYTTFIDEKLNELSAAVEINSKNLISINKKISDNEIILNQVSQTLNSNFKDSKLENLPNQFNELLKKNQYLHNEIKNLSNKINQSNIKIKDTKDTDDKINTKQSLSNLINLIILKFDNGLDIKEDLLLMKNQNIDESKNPYLEKLLVLSNKKFIGIENLKKEFEILMKDYLKAKYIKDNNNIFFYYLSNFISIEPNIHSNFKDDVLQNFSKIKNKLSEKDIKTSLLYLSTIEDSDIYFSKWIEEAEYYIDFNFNLKFFSNS